MTQQDLEIFLSWFAGESIGSLAKKYKLDKSQIKKVINRVSKERAITDTEILHELSANETSHGWNL
jgi:Mor family transcriptional regulator